MHAHATTYTSTNTLMQQLLPSIYVGARNEFDMTNVVPRVLACKASVKQLMQASKRPEIGILPRAQRPIGLGILALSSFEGLDSSEFWKVSRLEICFETSPPSAIFAQSINQTSTNVHIRGDFRSRGWPTHPPWS